MAGVGLTVPKLLPITGTWAAPFVLYSLLSTRIVSERIKTEQFIGDKPSSSQTQATSLSAEAPEPSALEIASRWHGNFLENVLLAFIFIGITELNGGNRKALIYAMAGLFALRIAHAELGLRLKGRFGGGGGMGRPIGYFGSNGVLLGLSGYAAWLVKGY